MLLSECEACFLDWAEADVGARLLLFDWDLERVEEAVKWIGARCKSRFPPCHLRFGTYIFSSGLPIRVPAQWREHSLLAWEFCGLLFLAH